MGVEYGPWGCYNCGWSSAPEYDVSEGPAGMTRACDGRYVDQFGSAHVPDRVHHHIVFDLELGRPACALLQAAMGGSAHIASRFPAEAWLLSPTDGMACYRISEADLVKLIARVEKTSTP